MSETQEIGFEELSEALEKLGASLDAAETHGILCGYICGGCGQKDLHWQTTLFDDGFDLGKEHSKSADTVIQAYQQAHTAVHSFDMEFEPLLPNDELPLTTRLQALKQWCQGFLAGIALTSVPINEQEDIQDIVEDLTEISKVSEENLKLDESEEEAYMNLVEHIRMATLFLHSLLNQNHQQTLH